MNNKGFAITTILYGMLILFLILLVAMLGILGTYKDRLALLVDNVNGARLIINPTGGVFVEESAPELDVGMIPVKIADDGTVTTVSSTDPTWYNYSNKQWANVVLVKNSGTQTREYYKNNPGTKIPEVDILAYYVWIPRYKYKIWTTDPNVKTVNQVINIEFEPKNESVKTGNTVGSWRTHPAFIWDGKTIAGIWVGKFESGHSTLVSNNANNLACTNVNCTNAREILIKPNISSLRKNSIAYQFYANRAMSQSGNPFGFDKTTTDTHMIKNSEWGAVAYLSRSVYGINDKIRRNNNSNYTTGCGALDTDKMEAIDGDYDYTYTTECQIKYGEATSYPQSTTGNISGIFDMSGGAWESVMGNYEDVADSGFGTLPEKKYYDSYSKKQFNYSNNNLRRCTIDTCGGQALFETAGWDYAGNCETGEKYRMVYDVYSWLIRGGGKASYKSKYVGIFVLAPIRGIYNAGLGMRSVVLITK